MEEKEGDEEPWVGVGSDSEGHGLPFSVLRPLSAFRRLEEAEVYTCNFNVTFRGCPK